MCRNITTLRGLEPPATLEEIDAAARQYVRKVSGITHPAATTEDAFERAVDAVAHVTADVLRDLPPRRRPPKAVPPLRRPEVRARQARRASTGGGSATGSTSSAAERGQAGASVQRP